ERGRDDDIVAEVLQRPGGVLARRAAAEVASGEQDLRALVLGAVELEVGPQAPVLVEAPVEEEELAEPGSLDPLEELLRDDLVGVDVGALENGGAARDRAERLHRVAASSHSRTSTKWPAIAAAAAIGGLTRCVRPSRPCRPSKLRFDV